MKVANIDSDKNELMSMTNPVQFHYHEISPMGRKSLLRLKGFVEKVRFEPGVKE